MTQTALILRNRFMPHFNSCQPSPQTIPWRAILAALILLSNGCQPVDRANDSDTAASRNALDRVTVGKPLRKTLQLFTEQPARVQAFEDTPIISKLPGYIQAVHVDIGDRVTKDQVLISLYAPEYKDQHTQKLGLVTQAEALVKQAEATVVAAEAASNSIKATIAEAEAGIAKAEAEFNRWESESQRIQELAATGSVTSKLAEETVSQYRSAAASKDEAIAVLAGVKAKAKEADANILKASSDLDVAKAKLIVANSELAQAETMLSYMELKAPFQGVVTSRSVDVGHFVQPAANHSSAPLLTIANIDKVRVFVSVPEAEAAWVNAGFSDPNQGDLVRLTSPTLTQPIETRVARTSSQLHPQSRTLPVEIELNNQEYRMLPGAFVTARILLEQRDNVIVLPITAVVKTMESTSCCVVVDGKVERRTIELGLRVGDEVEVTQGLQETDSVVLLRASSLQEGQAVEVIEKK